MTARVPPRRRPPSTWDSQTTFFNFLERSVSHQTLERRQSLAPPFHLREGAHLPLATSLAHGQLNHLHAAASPHAYQATQDVYVPCPPFLTVNSGKTPLGGSNQRSLLFTTRPFILQLRSTGRAIHGPSAFYSRGWAFQRPEREQLLAASRFIAITATSPTFSTNALSLPNAASPYLTERITVPDPSRYR